MKQGTVKNSIISVFLGGLISRAIGFIGSIVLARILVPEDFGYWVIVTMITSFFTLVIDAGFEYYYIVKVNINKGEETPQEEVFRIENTVFFLRVIVNLLLFVLQFGLSYLPIDLLASPVDKVIRVLAFIHIINIMGRINEVRLKKHFLFSKITVFSVIGSIGSILSQVVCAFCGLGVMSFAIGSLIGTTVNNIGLISVGRFKPDFHRVSKPLLKDVFLFAFHTWSGCVGQYFQSQIDKFLLKKNFTMTDVGYYSFSSGHSTMFLNYFVNPLGTVIMNFISNNQRQTAKLEEFVCLYNSFLLMAILPLQVLLYVFADKIVVLLFGSQWIPAITLFRLFLIKSLIDLMFNPYGFFLTAFGKVDYRAKLNWFAVFLFGIALLITTYFSSNIVVYSIVFVVCSLIISFIKSYMSIIVSKVSLRNIYGKLKNIILISIVMIALLAIPASSLAIRLWLSFIAFLIFIVLILLFERQTIIEIDRLLLGSKIKKIYRRIRYE